ncbi:MAG TPA: DUF2157 domain-containing protein, partial [Flavisolibacter sp.]|nr:DUF2157 domain-containing protein [Flavisolibacter sp.]
MNLNLFEKLYTAGLISDSSLQKLKAAEDNRLFSLHWELKTILYLGVTLLCGGLGILVYKNVGSIGHTFILLFIACVCCACFYYCISKKTPFAIYKVEAPDSFFDYILLLGCLTFITFIGYLQFQYSFFGNTYNLAIFIPMIILFISAYFFDHLGILSLAITNLAAWLGISIMPLRLFKENDLSNANLIYTGLALGLLLILAGLLSKNKNFKKHFEFTYSNFGTHIIFISCLSGLFVFNEVYL